MGCSFSEERREKIRHLGQGAQGTVHEVGYCFLFFLWRQDCSYLYTQGCSQTDWGALCHESAAITARRICSEEAGSGT